RPGTRATMDFDPVTQPELFGTDNKKSTIYTVSFVLLTFATILVALRFYTRYYILNLVGPDDWLVLLSLVFFAALVGCELILESRGLGHHIGTLPKPDGYKIYLQTFWVSIQVYNIAVTVVKMTFLAQYYRIMTLKKMRQWVLIVTGIVGAWSISQIFMGIFICVPVSGFWDSTPDMKCLPKLTSWYANAIGNIIADLLIIVLPLPMIRNLNLPGTQKLVLIGIFCLGFFTTSISASRIRFLGTPVDVTFENPEAEYWSLAEICSGIVCAVLPTLRPLAGKYLPTMFGSRFTRSGSYFVSGRRQTWQPKGTTSGLHTSSLANSSQQRRGKSHSNTMASSRAAQPADDEEQLTPGGFSDLGKPLSTINSNEEGLAEEGRGPGIAKGDVMEMQGMGGAGAQRTPEPMYPDRVYAGNNALSPTSVTAGRRWDGVHAPPRGPPPAGIMVQREVVIQEEHRPI
ncbi:hypothetical protein PpBr36_03809, partial [Pyricularia pennisetigena]|uniref:hypothetical protein n=1 Tax=Pyricularia pennisetigena TaxID=1578925 RepID=UPI0011521C53